MQSSPSGAQRRGIGGAALQQLEAFVRGLGRFSRLRAGVVATNSDALPFWLGHGFRRTGETNPYRYASIESTIAILAKDLPH